MSAVPDYILKDIKCCLNENQHILLEPVLLKCGGNACKGCISDSSTTSVNCLKCNTTHDKNDFIENKSFESVIKFFLKDLSKNLDDEIKSMKDLLTEENILDEMQLKIETLEDQMDLRLESLITEIRQFKDEYMEKLNKFKVDLKSLIKDTINIDCKIHKENSKKTEDSFEYFQEKQRELKIYQKEMLNYRTYINKFKFTSSTFSFNKKHLGLLETFSPWLNGSLILNDEEASWLAETIQSSKFTLLYRATQNGFTANAFHTKCDGKAKTITIIKTNGNYVFGGYTSAAWNNAGTYIADTNAFIFSLRRNGVSKCEKFMVKNPNAAIIGHYHYGPIFGGGNGHAVNNYCGHCGSYNYCGHGSNYSYMSQNGYESGCDIFIRDNSNGSYVCEANIGHSYNCPVGHTYGQPNTINFLAGNKKNWLTTEIEVYQINETFD